MTTEEIIAEAKRRYPIGTRYRNAVNPSNDESYVMNGDDVIQWVNDHHKPEFQSVTERGSSGILYSKGNWAEIISDIVNNFPIH
jgi:hypothetical protein